MENLENLLDLPPSDEGDISDIQKKDKEAKKHLREVRGELMNIDESSTTALVDARDIENIDEEIDTIAEDALEYANDLFDHGMNCAPSQQGKMFEVASSFLTTALNARMAKADKKLKLLKLQLEQSKQEQKIKADNIQNGSEVNQLSDDEDVIIAGRNDILSSPMAKKMLEAMAANKKE